MTLKGISDLTHLCNKGHLSAFKYRLLFLLNNVYTISMLHPLPYQFVSDVGNEYFCCLSSSVLWRFEFLLNIIPLVIYGKRVVIITEPYTEIYMKSCQLTDLEILIRKPIPVSIRFVINVSLQNSPFIDCKNIGTRKRPCTKIIRKQFY